jgi:hypothetical protein
MLGLQPVRASRPTRYQGLSQGRYIDLPRWNPKQQLQSFGHRERALYCFVATPAGAKEQKAILKIDETLTRRQLAIGKESRQRTQFLKIFNFDQDQGVSDVKQEIWRLLTLFILIL